MSDPMANLADFVLKLKFLGSDDEATQIRRVRLPRIRNSQTGAISYEELIGIAISFVIPEKPVHASDFQVKLSYQDVDEDIVVLGSSEELLDAIDQYKEQRVLRITAEVKRTGSSRAIPSPHPSLPLPTTAPSSRASSDCENKSNDAGVQTRSDGNLSGNTGTPVLQNVVESVVNIILNAAVALNGGQGAPPVPSGPVFYTPEGVPSEPESTDLVPSEPTASVSSDPAAIVPSSGEMETAVEAVDPPTDVVPAKKSAVVPTQEPEAPVELPAPEKVERPFIHGRHTCDSCLTTPIVGKRYHALNMSDYDLCAKCYSSYGGGEIQFESVELERDRHLQNRWHRRRERMNNNGRGPARRFGPRGHHTRWGPGPNRRGSPPHGSPPPHPPHGPRPPQPPHEFHPPMPVHPPPRGPRGFRGPPPPPPGPPHQFPSWKGREEQKVSEENAMAMAIKLSLQDIKPPAATPNAAPQLSVPVPVETAETQSSSAIDAKRTATAVSTTTAVKKVVEEQVVETAETSQPVCVETVTDAEENVAVEPAATPSAPMEEQVNSTASSKADAAEVKVETVEDDDNEEASVGSDPFVVRMPSSDGSFCSEVSGIKSHASNPPVTSKGSRESSFSSDAAGNGEIADMLGETLDKCAEAIDAMVSELDRTSLDTSSAASSYVGVNDEAEECVASEEGAEEGTAAEGATIVESQGQDDGDDDLSATAERSEEDWQVVSENQQSGSDEELARAAQMIGSALFNSDMRSSGEMTSTLAGSAAESDVISHASSALTSVPSVTSNVAAVQRQRWATQLAQLRTLGVDDDGRCVEILERLTAANIGCGSNDEVSVQEVVNELWK